MLEVSLASRRKQPQQKILALKKCLLSFGDAEGNSEARHLGDYVNLLERQVPVDVSGGGVVSLTSQICFEARTSEEIDFSRGSV